METPGAYYSAPPRRQTNETPRTLVLKYMRKCYADTDDATLSSCLERVGKILSELDETRRRHELEHLLDGRTADELCELQNMIRQRLDS